MEIVLITFSVLFLIVITKAVLHGILKEDPVQTICIKKSAKRINLRDKGEVEADGEGYSVVHSFCNTTIRIGITPDGVAWQYCWRCEEILEIDDEPDPGDEEDVPEKNNDNNVVRLVKIA